jgi:hypothetical protein
MAKKGKPKKTRGGEEDGSLDSLPYHGLLVKISSDVAGEIGGKMFLIPTRDLHNFLFLPQNQAAFDQAIDDPLVNVEYAIFTDDFRIRGSAG